jgi:hypothetical protein
MALPLNFETAAQEIRGVLEDFLRAVRGHDRAGRAAAAVATNTNKSAGGAFIVQMPK